MKNHALFAAVVCLALAGKAAIFNPEKTSSWFSEAVSAYTGDASLTTPPWTTKPTEGYVRVDASKPSAAVVEFDTESSDPLVYTPQTTTTSAAQRLEIKAYVEAGRVVPDVPTSSPQAALTVVSDGTTCTWYGLQGGTSTSWVALTGNTPAEETWYDVMIELDDTPASPGKRIRYSVKTSGAAVYTELKPSDAADGWLTNPQQSATAVATLSFSGFGKFGNLSGVGVEKSTSYDVGGGGSIVIEDTWSKQVLPQGIEPGTPAAATYMNTANDYGVAPWQAYVLGYEANQATAAKVVVKAPQNDKPAKLTFALDDMPTLRAGSGKTVSYEIETASSSDFSGSEKATIEGGARTVDVDLPSDGVKYYRINVKIQ